MYVSPDAEVVEPNDDLLLRTRDEYSIVSVGVPSEMVFPTGKAGKVIVTVTGVVTTPLDTVAVTNGVLVKTLDLAEVVVMPG